jgi:hypothetical protein
MNSVTEFMSQSLDITNIAGKVHHDIGMDLGDRSVAESSSPFSWDHGRIDPFMSEEISCDLTHFGVESGVGFKYQTSSFLPLVLVIRFSDRSVTIKIVEFSQTQNPLLEPVEAGNQVVSSSD